MRLDSVFIRFITCQTIDEVRVKEMLLAFQDRLRIPWRGGAKQVSFGTLIPIVAIPLAFAIAAINGYVTVIVIFTSSLLFISYAYYYISKRQLRTRFFLAWIFWSVVYMTLLFELTVPLLELLPEENLILVIMILGALYFLWRTHALATLNQVNHQPDNLPSTKKSILGDDNTDTILTDQAINLVEPESEKSHLNVSQLNCKYCTKSLTDHCYVCSFCILHRRHHSYWLDCCIGEWNYRHYIFGLFLAELALILGSNLTLTAICHPFLVIRLGGIPIMLPDDCSGVYDDYKLSLAFVIAIYAGVIAASIFFVLIQQFYLLLRAKYKRNIFTLKKSLSRNGPKSDFYA